LQNSTNTQVVNHTFYNNRYDFYVVSSASVYSFNMTTSYFLNPLGTYANYTVLSINDSVTASTSFFINWTTNSSTLPSNYVSFAQKYVNISNISGAVSIDAITWSWLDSELSGYDESKFGLWKYNTTWTLLNNTPNTTAHSLSLTSMNPASIYAILQDNSTTANCPVITSSGTTTMAANYTGAPNNVSEVLTNYFACVKIASSNVIFDCNGYNITGDGTDAAASGWIGIVLNGSLTNVTVKNCPAVSNYTYGIYAYWSNYSVFTNNTAYNNSQSGFQLSSSNYSNLTNNSAYNNSYGFYFINSSNNTLTGNNLTNNTNNGVKFDSLSTGQNLTSNLICYNSLDVNNQGTTNNGTLDRCDSFASWSEGGRLGCTRSCSSMWQRFFGTVNGNIVLGSNYSYVYRWNASGLNVYFVDYDSAINWNQLQAISRNTTNDISTNDFTELDVAFATTSFADNINSTYSTDGSNPKETQNFTVFGRSINYVPVANSTATNTSFRTGILWDMADGGTQYNNSINQTTVWVVKVNTSAPDVYGTYDYLVQIPYTLGSREGSNNVVSIYAEMN